MPGSLYDLSGAENLIVVNFSNSKILTGDLAVLGSNANLRVLELGKTSVSGDLATLSRCFCLEVINLEGTNVSGENTKKDNISTRES